ncbi:MAG: hypothetical protein R8G66_12105 [Cytophagales bacterium]|nr:hypothetical protein [Cytophagales bacterium]
MNQIQKVIIWVMIGTVFVLFWLSLRDEAHALEYGTAALLVWGATHGLQYLFKKKT